MTSLLNSQIPWIVWLQQFDGLLPAMRAFSFLGNGEFFLLLLPFFYFCIDARIGLRLGLLVLCGDVVNLLCKFAFAMPRPYWVDSGVRPLSQQLSFGLPSGHAQGATSVWFYLAGVQFCRRRQVAAVVLVALISLSRVYLGVHFWTDVAVGWILGAGVLYLFLRYEPVWEAWFEPRSMRSRIKSTTAITLLLLVLGLALRSHSISSAMSASWAGYAGGAFGLEQLVSRLGALWGLGMGWALVLKGDMASAKGPLQLRFLRWLLGMIGVLFFWKGLVVLLPLQPGAPALIFRFFRYALMTLWVTYFAPKVFLRLGLATVEPGTVTSGALGKPGG